MTTRDEIEQAVQQLINDAADYGRVSHTHKAGNAAIDKVFAAKTRLLALIAPTPASGDVTDAEIEAGAKDLHYRKAYGITWEETAGREWQDDMRGDAKAVLVAAKAARATGAGVSE